MRKFIESLFGVVFVNRILLALNGKREMVKFCKGLFSSYARKFSEGNAYEKAYLVFAPIANVFLLSGFFPFVLIVASDTYFVKKIVEGIR